MITGRRALGFALGMPLAGAAALAAGGAGAQDGPVTLLVPYTPGTGQDILARLLAPYLQQGLGQAVVVDNRPGASGNIGTQAAARAAPDGRTLLLQANTFVMNPSLFRQVPYDPVGSFAPVIRLTRGDLVLAVNPDVPAEDARAFAALAARQPLDYASPGLGTPQHLGMALFGLEARVALNHVPYKGSAPAIQDLIGRRVAAMVLPLHTALPLAGAGQVRLLAVGSPARVAAAPSVPTMAEAGFPGVQVDLWYGLLGPAGLPAPLLARLNAALNAWLALPGTQEPLRAQGMQPVGGTPEAFAAVIAADLARWAGVIRAAGITAE
ncbi:tripartite tricarboxylate transporter substrate binding protein [Paracraurococcus lichenis]|uniref:Tripartite tricarboxylate transporter substrate binding protein n=1 Tax=Paracraurococcus lichenis TaxID=3064888 RepID=A0ABT9DVN4_9PROT|nr:tripartite tricarboxylate transporter substrate binding protein [Paracraurococcus sp. LOR1-02]MDO9707965.1 tripartite tricarboxylate transporter substrate binding protein [Paracraurococcus sp. LOR1-02]